MGELIIRINSKDRKKYDLDTGEMSFSDLEKKIILAQAREALERTAKRAKEAGLDKLSNKDISRSRSGWRKSAINFTATGQPC